MLSSTCTHEIAAYLKLEAQTCGILVLYSAFSGSLLGPDTRLYNHICSPP